MTTLTLTNRKAIVTGASAGIGQAIATSLFQSGGSIVLNARREDKLKEIKNEWIKSSPSDSGRVALAPGDASDINVINEMFAVCRETFGSGPDLVVVNAGRGLSGSVLTADLDELEAVLKINITAATLLMRQAGKSMIEDIGSGKWYQKPRDIVVLGSTVGRHISPFSAVYGATKFAVNSLAEGFRREVGPKGIRVSLIEPGIVSSEFQEVAGYSEEWKKDIDQKFGPLLIGDDIARAINFIVSQPAHVAVGDIVIRPTRQDYP